MASCAEFGTLFIANEYSTLQKYKNAQSLNADLFLPSVKNFASGILISPQPDADLSGYSRIILLDGLREVRIPSLEGKEVLQALNCAPSYISGLSTERTDLLSVFAILAANVNNIQGTSCEEAAKLNDLGCSPVQAVFALKVFEELNLITFEGGVLRIFRGIKTDLNNSPLYVTVKRAQAEEGL